MPRPADTNLFTTKEARGYVGGTGKPIAHDTLLSYVERGLLRQYHGQIGKSVYYDRRELEALLRVVPQRGKPKFTMPPVAGTFEAYLAAKYPHLKPYSTFLGVGPEFLPVPVSIAPLLRVPEVTPAICQRVLQGTIEPDRLDGAWTRWRISENWYHPQFADEQMRVVMSSDPAFDALTAIGERHSVSAKELLIKVRARKPVPEELDLLVMTLDQPVIEMLCVSYTLSQRDIVLVNRLVVNAELLELEFEYPGGPWEQ